MKHLYLCLEAIMLLLGFVSCTDEEIISELGLPVDKAVNISAETLEKNGWQWGTIMSTSEAGDYVNFLCGPDLVDGGYLAALNRNNSISPVVYKFDGEGNMCYMSYTDWDTRKPVEFMVKYVGEEFWVTTIKDGRLTHLSYPSTKALSEAGIRVDAGSSEFFAAVASAVLDFNSRTGLLPAYHADPSWDKMLEQVAANSCINAPANATMRCQVYDDVAHLVDLDALRAEVFGDAMAYVEKNDMETDGRGSFDLKINGVLPPTTFSRQAGDYGSEVENKVYSGLFIGHDMNVGLGNYDYNIPGELVQKPGEVHHIVLPELPQGIYYVRPYLISEQERDALERGEVINSCWLQAVDDSEPYCRLDASLKTPEIVGDYYYDGESQTVEYNVRLSVKVPQIPKIPISYPIVNDNAYWGIKVVYHPFDYESVYLDEQTQAYDGIQKLSLFVPKSFIAKQDKENYRAEVVVDFVLYCLTGNNFITLAKVPYTFVYDKKPELVYEDAYLTQALCNTDTHRDVLEDAIYTRSWISGAFWFDDGKIRYMEENGASSIEMGTSLYASDMKEPAEGYDFYKHFLTWDFKTTKAYTSVTVNGKELRSNEVHYVWSADKQKIEKVYLDK